MDEILYNETIYEPGTVATAELSDSDEDPWGEGNNYSLAAILERKEVSGIADELEYMGCLLARKQKESQD